MDVFEQKNMSRPYWRDCEHRMDQTQNNSQQMIGVDRPARINLVGLFTKFNYYFIFTAI